MRGRNLLLIVTSIVMILLGGYALVVDLLDISNPEQGFRIISSLAASAICVFAGFFGVLSKSKKGILIVGILLSLVTIIDVVIGIGFFDMGLFHLTLLIWPVLYLLGWHVSDRK
ncbi:MAG: hypothetical protein FWE44_07605 [Defluviitaleaceae bacterium]|nr:hypothetical protein [Defluviitaleaceae bacterium]